jgi:RNA polymerase sigma-70 factor (ECF subfamily)
MQPVDEDIGLMLAFRAGDGEALSTLYQKWAAPLLRYLERIVKNPATAEELLQDTFIRVHGARDRYSADARFSTWLFRIGRNLALNELDRARNRSPHLQADAPANAAADAGTGRKSLSLVSSEPSQENVADARKTKQRMERALVELPERQRSALWLAAVEGYSYAEVASVLETSTASVKSLVHRARVELADRMEAEEMPTSAVTSKSGVTLETKR